MCKIQRTLRSYYDSSPEPVLQNTQIQVAHLDRFCPIIMSRYSSKWFNIICISVDGLLKLRTALIILSCSLSSSLIEDLLLDKYSGHSAAFGSEVEHFSKDSL